MKEENINNQVVEVLYRKFNRPYKFLERKNWEKPLTGEPFYLSDIEMVYLLFELEKKYSKCVNSECLGNYGYNTIRNITNIMENI
ncbi:hypothetical protein KQI61_06260 [Anaerocolumna aminovalerica]|uniref:hypothetical protein n=1 Tax=Anaerocolumna aminovalerica TaxID=1527 RepID=UPI001C0EF9C0|nr:hypothetical protein [Anaerocolumna aminovalerica]MBU5331794.1 hypothetical protein [Anaerocolumna aminovalerica]